MSFIGLRSPLPRRDGLVREVAGCAMAHLAPACAGQLIFRAFIDFTGTPLIRADVGSDGTERDRPFPLSQETNNDLQP
jgi:hypothetical protein